MASRWAHAPALWLPGAVLLAACAGNRPGGEAPVRDSPVERVEVAVRFQPQVEWEVKSNRNFDSGGAAGGAIAGASLACIGTGPFVGICLAVALPIGAAAAGVAAMVAHRRGEQPLPAGEQGAAVRVIDLRELAGVVDLESRLRGAIAHGGWRVESAGEIAAPQERENALRLEMQVERMKALSSAPIRNLWVHEMQVNWRLVELAAARPVADGSFNYEKVLSFSLRFDEASGRWVGKDDGRFAAAWARACEEIAERVAREAVPAIAAHRR